MYYVNMNYEEIETQLKNFETDYNNNVCMFNIFSEVGNLKRKKINCDFYNTNKNGVDCEINNNDIILKQIDNTVKKLLKNIHPDKIIIIFGSENPELLDCSTKIMQNNLSLFDAIHLLYTNLPNELFYNICNKIKLSNEQIDTILKTHKEEHIDDLFDKKFLELIHKYNNMKTKSIHNYIHSQVTVLFNNLNNNYATLIAKITYKIKIIEHDWTYNDEEKIMSREDYPLEKYLNKKTISLEVLAKLYPNSEYAKTVAFINQHLFNKISFDKYHITITLYMIAYHTFEKFIDIGTNILYTNFKYNLSCPKT
jgi:hypothetical protein